MSGFLNIVTHQDELERVLHRVGLDLGRTGIPLILVCSESASEGRVFSLRSRDQARQRELEAGCPLETQGWEQVRAFFEAGGTEAIVGLLPVDGVSQLRSLMGRDGGPGRRTGIKLIRDAAERCDLVCVPQAAQLLQPEELRTLWEEVGRVVDELAPLFFIADIPPNMGPESARRCTQGWYSSDSAAFYPWLLGSSNQLIAPSVLVAALIQKVDRSQGPQTLPSNRELGFDCQPLYSLAPSELNSLASARVNCFITRIAGDTRLWGGATLADPLDRGARYLSVRRTSRHLREALSRLCEKYVLEPISHDLPVVVETGLENFLQSVQPIFDTSASRPYVLKAQIGKSPEGEVLNVDFTYRLPLAVTELNVSMAVGE